MAKKAVGKTSKKAVEETTNLSTDTLTPKTEKKEDIFLDVESVDIVKGNIYIRTFSLEVHGEKFLDLAKQFVSKYSSREVKMIPSDPEAVFAVRYRELDGVDPDVAFHKKSLKEQDNITKDWNKDKPFVDKEKNFTSRDEAIEFNIYKKGTILIKK